MKIDVLTLSPKMFDSPLGEGVLGRALKKGLVKIKTHDMRQWAWNSYGAVDDRPFGGGVGMLIRPDVVSNALDEIEDDKEVRVVVLSAKGKRFNQKKAEELSKEKKLVLVCGRYEGFDQRTIDEVDDVISVGDYVLSGGEIPAMIIIDAIVRLLPGALGKDESSLEESFSKIKGKRRKEYPQYTRPQVYKGGKVPKVLVSGNHKKIEEWRQK